MQLKSKKLTSNSILTVILLVFVFLPRLYDLGATTIYPDEIIWMTRSRELFYAIFKGNFEYFNHAWWFFTHATVALGIPLLLIIAPFQQFLGQNPSIYSLQIMPEIVASRLPHALFMCGFLFLFYFFTKKLSNKYVAFIGTILLALDPVFLQSSRTVLQDAMLSTFCFLAICSFFLIKNNKQSITLTSLFAALAFLSKPTGLLIFVALAPALFTNSRQATKKMGLILVGMCICIYLLWPYLWQNPLFAFTYLWNQATIATLGSDNFFLGQITKSPPITYYLFQIATRLPVLIVILLISSIHHLKKLNKVALGIILFNLTYLVVMSIMDKKLGPRYILPLWPWIYLASAISFWQLINKSSQTIKILGATGLIIYQLTVAISYYPDYYLFYNSFIGGSKNAQKYDIPDLCYGTREAVEYIDTCFPEIDAVAILGSSKTVAPYYSSLKITTDWQKEKLIILEHAHETLLPHNKDVLEIKKSSLVKNIFVKGAHTATIYTSDLNITNYCE